MNVQLFIPCFVDQLYPGTGFNMIKVLEKAGCKVKYNTNQTCCGQPAFNGGDWPASRKVVRHTVKTFAGADPVIVPSGSCAGMLFHGAVLEFEHEKDLPEVEALGRRSLPWIIWRR